MTRAEFINAVLIRLPDQPGPVHFEPVRVLAELAYAKELDEKELMEHAAHIFRRASVQYELLARRLARYAGVELPPDP